MVLPTSSILIRIWVEFLIGQFILEVIFSIRLGPMRWVPTAHCAGRRGLNLLTAVSPVELAHCVVCWLWSSFSYFHKYCKKYLEVPWWCHNGSELSSSGRYRVISGVLWHICRILCSIRKNTPIESSHGPHFVLSCSRLNDFLKDSWIQVTFFYTEVILVMDQWTVIVWFYTELINPDEYGY